MRTVGISLGRVPGQDVHDRGQLPYVFPMFSYTQIYAQRPPLLGPSASKFYTNQAVANMRLHSKTFFDISKNTIDIFVLLSSFFDIFPFFFVFRRHFAAFF